MFEGIRFIEFEGEYGSGFRSGKVADHALWDDFDFAGIEDADYNVAGRLRLVLPAPLSDDRAKGLVHMQSFGYMDVGGSYYTRRKGYQSKLLLCTYAGSGRLRYAGEEYALGPGDAFLIDCMQPHEYWTAGSSWSHSDLHFAGGMADLFWREVLSAYAPVFRCPGHERLQQQLEAVLRAYQEESFERDFRTSFELERLLFLAAAWMGAEGGGDGAFEPVQRLRAHLDRTYTEHMSLDDMADYVGLSKYYLCRRFKRVIGMTPAEYVTHLRIRQAQQLLATTTIPGYRIGQLVGFRSEAGFISQFKRATGVTPNVFRTRGPQIA